MLTFAIIATITATAAMIGTAVLYHIEAGDVRRERSLAKLRTNHLRDRTI